MEKIMIKKILVALVYMCSASVVYADSSETGKITRIIAEGYTKVSIWLDGDDDTSDCAGGGRWTINSNDLLHKEKLSMLLAAATTEKPVHLLGLTTWGCGSWDSNQIYYVDITY